MEQIFPAGTIILKKNTASNFFFMIVRGKVKIEAENNTFFLSDNDFFGEESAFLKKSNPYMAIASEETVIQIFNAKEAKEYIFANPAVFFPIFTKNISRTWECIEPIDVKHSSYIRFLEKIFPYVTVSESDTPVCELSILSEELSSRIDFENIYDFILSVEHLGHVKIDKKGKIFTVGKKNLQKITGAYYENRNFALISEIKGCGFFPLLNKLKTGKK